MSSEDALSASELLEQEKEVPEELSRRLYINGGFLIIQGLPRNAEVGIDYKSFNIGEKFMGMKMVPNGLHYAFIRATPQSPMVSFFFYSGAHEIVYRKWNKQSETFDSPEIMDNTLMHHMQYNVKTYDRNLGHYAFDIYKTWHCLSSYISKDTILRLQPTNPGGYIDAQPEATTMEAEVDKNRPKGTQSYQVVDRNHPTRLRFADEEGLPNLIEKQGTKLRFTEVPNVTFEETMKKRSGVDGSDRLIQFIRRCGGEREFLGEFQVAYITFIVGHVHDSFVQWKKIIHLVCSCKAIMPQNPQLFSSFLATLHFHMKSHGDDYFHDELSKSSFLLYTLANLFANIADLEATPQSYELIVRSRRFKSILEKKFRVIPVKMRELFHLLFCAFCVGAVSGALLPSTERTEYLTRLLERASKTVERGEAHRDVYEEPDVDGLLEAPAQENSNCPSGWMGRTCKNPICNEKVPIHVHDGTVNEGETIEVSFSEQCSDVFYFPVDSYLHDVNIFVLQIGKAMPDFDLFDTNGSKIQPDADTFVGENGYIANYKGLTNNRALGKFYLQLKSNSDSPCIAQVLAPTPVVVDGGFITDQRSDRVEKFTVAPNKGIYRNPVVDVASYFAFKVSAIQYPADAVQVKFTQDNQLVGTPYNVTARYRCSASSIASASVTCSDVGANYAVKVIGIDANGFFFQRVYDYDCDAALLTTPSGPLTTPTPTTAGPPPTVCLNGGTMLNAGQNDASCYCGDLYEGRQCERKICFNDAVLNGDVCLCPTGYSGNHCLDVVCERPSDGTFDISRRALAFVVRGGSSMSNLIPSVYNAAKLILTLIPPTNPDYFETFVLIEYHNHNIVNIVSTRVADDFLAAIEKIDTTKDAFCQDGTLSAISTAITMHDLQKYPNSPVFVFSDGLPDDNEIVKVNLLNQLAYFRGQLNFLMVKDPDAGCSIDDRAPGYRTLRELARFSQGIVAKVDASDASEFAGLVFDLAYATESADYIHSNDFLESCNNAPKFQSIFVDDSSDRFYVIASGDRLNITAISPNRKTIQPDILASNGDLSIVAFNTNSTTGNYLIRVTSPSGAPCHYRVTESSMYDMFFSTSRGLFDDSSSIEPVYNQESHVVARIEHMPPLENRHLQAEVIIWANEGLGDKRVVLYASSGVFRDGCDYNIYFGSWTCPNRDMLFYVTVFADDRNGFTVQRTTTGICSAVIPPPIPPSGCLNGGVGDSSNNGTCLCAPGFQGDKCQQIICQNGGQAHAAGYCTCPAGFTGQFCEVAACYQYNNGDFSPTKRSMTFFVHDSLSTREMIKAMTEQASQMVQDITHQHPDWINHYQLIRFSDASYSVAADSSDPNAFISGLQNMLAHNGESTYTCMNLNILEPMYLAMKEPSFTRHGYIFVFLSGVMKQDYLNYDDVFEVAEIAQTPITFVQFAQNPCGMPPQNSLIGIMQGLALSTGGQYLQADPADAGNVLLSLPSLYSSNLVFEQTIDDCASKPVSFYFPVDSQAQSFSANIIGSLRNAPSYVAPETADGDLTEVNLWNDFGVSRFDLVIRECDGDWDSHGSQCYLAVPDAASWTDAQSFCHQRNSALVTVLSKDVQTYLDSIDANNDYWLGLNDRQIVGQWRWDQIGENQLGLSGFSNWAPGMPTKTPTQRCVYQQGSSSKQWVVADCAQQKMFMCVKHAYDFNYEPGKLDRVHLPRGMWRATMQTWSGACSLKVRAQSGIRLSATYTTNLHNDWGFPELIPGNATQNFMAAHATGLSSSEPNVPLGKLDFAQMYITKDRNMVLAEPFYHRDNCAFDFITRPFACPAPAFQVAVSGVDSYGYPFQRIIPAVCYGGNADHTCENGGFYDEKRGACLCGPNFEGNRCEFAICRNGNLGAGLSDCVCNVGWSGQFCEIPVCTRDGNLSNPYTSAVEKTFVVLVDGCTTELQGDVIHNIVNLINDVLKTANGINQRWFSSFVGIVFRSAGAKVPLSAVISSTDSQKFLQTLQKELTINADQCAGDSERLMMNAVTQLMNEKSIAPRSEAFLITSGSAADYSMARAALDAIALTHTALNVFVMGADGPPGNASSYSDPEVQSMMLLAHNSGGGFYQLPNYKRLHKLFVGDMGTLFDSYGLGTRFVNCTDFHEYFQVGSKTAVLAFDIFAESTPVVDIVNPLGNHTLPTSVAISKTNSLFLVKNEKLPPGLWHVSVHEQGAKGGFCQVNIRGVSDETIFVGFSQDVGLDGGVHSNQMTLFPDPSAPNAIVVSTSFGTPEYVQIFTNTERKLLWASPLLKRKNCAYDYITKDVFECKTEDSVSVAVDGVDEDGHPFRRILPVHCI